ncbi:VacJ family lipoprotein [Pasteurella skyensis]|uniref:VacJ family lipoprotein n=1 Tax=Phocoenobacter skyensis TaxID=97481 RepID=A0AAJ6N9J6_9PAST|nr:VacJ family lipoprotein [Pasteurella skyensis]MDP8162243.1 VacJ family lipoprotein [Pasteurella skyensis]MDP8172707.1 VacJ family lipoprotein [Pasteurella skyensis]MDP8176869.1 VacJ family lipoprotein [Pasteurella skyensis]MDP8179207.1 VacJ family lipoprotein [Pasteurella skyensis]MDP8183338.1 VacJ family lipoprotein [Pasteurella skyensis]
MKRLIKSVKKIGLISAVIILTACSSIDPETGARRDPLEGFNRAMWAVNYNVLDPYVLKPVAKGWRDYVPSPVKTGLTNVSNNLSEPASFLNRLLEGEGEKAMVHFTRFWINSTFGLGGLIDFASQKEDLRVKDGRTFSHTLGTYGMGDGPYIMLPILGPKSPRALLSEVDYTYPVLSLLTLPATIGKKVVDGIDARSKLLDQDEMLKQSQDPYITFREAYFQHKSFELRDGKAKEIESQERRFSEAELEGID